MSAMSAYFLAHDAHRADSRAAEASYSRRSSLNPFHHNSFSEEHPETEQERRRSSVAAFARKVRHGLGNLGPNMWAREVDYTKDAKPESVETPEERETRLNEVY